MDDCTEPTHTTYREEAIFLERRGLFPIEEELIFFAAMVRGKNSTQAARIAGCVDNTRERGDGLYLTLREYIDAWLEEDRNVTKLVHQRMVEGLSATKYLPSTANDPGGVYEDLVTRFKYCERWHKLNGMDKPVKTQVEVSSPGDGEIPPAIRERLDAVYKKAGK